MQAQRDSFGRFTEGSTLAKELGKLGGKKAHQSKNAHRLTKDEQAKGGRISRKVKTK